MPPKSLEAITEHFSKVVDPRTDRTKEHKLIDIIAICAVICGAQGWTDMENFGNSKLHWLKTFLEVPQGANCILDGTIVHGKYQGPE